VANPFGTLVLVIAGLFCLLTTWSSGAAPARFARRLGLAIADAGGYNEIRAQYAGFFLAVAGVCAASLAGAVPRQAAFIMLAVVFGGLIAGRLAGLALNGGLAGYSPTIRMLYAIDSIGFAAAIATLVLEGRA
jgi:Domain of unknown function (DUF4345)